MTQAHILPTRRRTLFHPGLVGAGATLLIAAFVSDVLYWQTLLFQWNNVSQWLVAGGEVMALLAAIAFIVDLALRRVGQIAWLRFIGLAIVAALGLLNAFVHSRDAYTAVVPQGIVLSAITTLILLVIGLTGGWTLASDRMLATRCEQESLP